jgi:hypothetical protein
MHGDESTATLALMDIFNFLATNAAKERWVADLLEGTTMFFIPMLNPDGAEYRERRTAAGIDMNRDALELATPEARILHDVQRRVKPAFGFNLHDQELSSVGSTTHVAAIALLAPAADETGKKSPVRTRAIRLAAHIARTLENFIPGNVARYDDTFEPRAFGDNMQRWGTSTVLIESGHWPDDPEKKFIRKLNFVGILAALHAIAQGSYQDVELDCYLLLPPNAKRVYDIIIRGLTLQHGARWSRTVDVGILFDPQLNKDSGSLIATVKDMGDLSTFGALRSVDGTARSIRTGQFALNQSLPLSEILNILQLPPL